MKKTSSFSVGAVLLLAGTCCGADLFYLTNTAAHTNYGPFEYVHGGKVTVGGQALEIRRNLTDEERITYRLRKIIVPEIDFRGACLSNVVEFFQKIAVENERPPMEDGTNAIRFLLAVQPDEANPGTKDRDRPICEGMGRFVSLYTAIQEVCRWANLEFKIEKDTVVFTRRKAVGGPQPAAGDDRCEAQIVAELRAVMAAETKWLARMMEEVEHVRVGLDNNDDSWHPRLWTGPDRYNYVSELTKRREALQNELFSKRPLEARTSPSQPAGDPH